MKLEGTNIQFYLICNQSYPNLILCTVHSEIFTEFLKHFLTEKLNKLYYTRMETSIKI